MGITLAAKKLPAHLLQHLRSTHDFGSRVSVSVRNGMQVSIEGNVDGSEILSVFDMERGPVVIERVAKMNPFTWDRAQAVAGAYRKTAGLVQTGHVGITSSHTYAGLAHCGMVMSDETLALYFDLGAMDSVKKLSDVERLILWLQANESGARRKEAFELFEQRNRISVDSVLQQLRAKNIVRPAMTNRQTGAVTSWALTVDGREVLGQLKYGDQRSLERLLLGQGY